MITASTMNVSQLTDAELVGETLSGNRDAFGQIVARYQSLICSLAYSATGSLGQSEDLAQETFITAWKHLTHLRERDKLRSWLGGIARNRINDFLRREGRKPIHQAEPLENAEESHSPEPLPVEYIITREEQAILWHTLERIPAIYREPLVLFYRENQSVEHVAQALGLSDEVVHQRLSRGRKMLQEQVLSFVEGALKQTNPGKAFTLGVLGALPLLATTAKAATAGTAVAKSGPIATGLGAVLQSLLKIIIPIAPFVSLGGWLGYKMGGDSVHSEEQRNVTARFWGTLAICMILFVLLPVLLYAPLMMLFGSKEHFLTGMRIWLDVLYGVVALSLGLWIYQRRKVRKQGVAEKSLSTRIKNIFIWAIALAMIVAASFFVLALSDTNGSIARISSAQADKIIQENNPDAQFYVMRFHYHSAFKTYKDSYDELWIRLQENGKFFKFIAPADKANLSLLAEKRIECPTYVQDRDFEVFGWQGKLLMGLFLFVLAAGIAVVVTLWFKNKSGGPFVTKGTKIGIIGAATLAAIIVIPLAWSNHRRANTVHPNQTQHSNQPAQLLTPESASSAQQADKDAPKP